MQGGLLLLLLRHGGGVGAGVVAERGAEAGGELGLPEVERGEGWRGVAVGGGDEASGPARAPGPAEQEAEERRRGAGCYTPLDSVCIYIIKLGYRVCKGKGMRKN